MQWEKDQANIKKGKDDPNGLPDFVVTKAVVYPNRPKVNYKDVEIDISIKNIGTKTADGGAPLIATLLGYAKQTPVQGGPLFAITPGESVIWTFRPYSQNEFFKVSDTAGQKTIQIELNKYREVEESNYNNNIFTQKLEMYVNEDDTLSKNCIENWSCNAWSECAWISGQMPAKSRICTDLNLFVSFGNKPIISQNCCYLTYYDWFDLCIDWKQLRTVDIVGCTDAERNAVVSERDCHDSIK